MPAKRRDLTVSLIKTTFVDGDNFLGERPATVKNLGTLGTLYISRAVPHPARWADFFEDFVPAEEFGPSSSPAALLVVPAAGRVFALSFGLGRFLLKSESCEENFGLRVALNTVDPDQLRSIDKNTLDSIGRHSREQASRGASAADFGFDVEQDLLRAVTGPPRDSSLGKLITGLEPIRIVTNRTIHEIPELLNLLYAYYEDSGYKERFPWVDQISEISDIELRDRLDHALIQRAQLDNREGIWMAVPEVIAWHQVHGFRFGRRRKDPFHQDIHIDDFLESVGTTQNLTVQLLSRRHVECVDSEDRILHKWTVYKCLSAEIEVDGQTFVLSNGKWYRVLSTFVDQVNHTYNEIPRYAHSFPAYEHSSEDDYLTSVTKPVPNDFALMHTRTIPYGGIRQKVEFCDLYGIGRDIVHVKRYGSSRVLSHLFAQGTTSAQLFLSEPDFRSAVNDLLPHRFKISDAINRPNPGSYRVVFAIVSDRAGPLTIPFFARLNLRNTFKELATRYGYEVALAKIEVSDSRRLLKRYKAGSRR